MSPQAEEMFDYTPLGPGYWLMMSGTALVFVGVVAATYASLPSEESVSLVTREQTPKIWVSDRRAAERELVAQTLVDWGPK